MYTSIYIYVYIYINIHMNTYSYTYVLLRWCVVALTFMCLHAQIYTHVCVHACICVHAYKWIYLYTYIHIFIYIYIYININLNIYSNTYHRLRRRVVSPVWPGRRAKCQSIECVRDRQIWPSGYFSQQRCDLFQRPNSVWEGG